MAEIVVAGASGMVGRAVVEALAGRRVSACARAELDVTSAESIRGRVGPGARVVVCCAAWTDVDGAEAQRDAAFRTNAEGPGLLAARCAEVGAALVHLSTDYVFDGRAAAPVATDHPLAPINAYGESKAEGERRVRASGAAHLIVRTSWVYAPWGRNFVRTIARAAAERERLQVVADQRGRPTSALHLARQLVRLVDAGARGTLHVTDGGECTWFELATEVARRVRPACVVEPCATADWPTAARRPAYSVLDVSEAERLLGPMPSWKDNVAEVLSRGGLA
jgi:dTDP-4-dehydrorhamnose reductase